MATPFSSFKNASITFKVRNTTPVPGSYGYLETDLKDVVVECYLKQKKDPLLMEFENSNQQEIYVEGKCIEPKTIPSDVRPNTISDCTFNGVNYKIRLISSLPSPFYQENKILGQRIRGYLIQTSVSGGQTNG